VKLQIVKQHSEEDCGAACLATVAKYYKKVFTLNRIRLVVGTGQQGTSLLGLRRGAEFLGFYARSVQASSAILQKMNLITFPVIIHWRGNHYVVLYGKKNKKYIIADPAIGIRYIEEEELVLNWTNFVMLMLEPDPARFFDHPEDQARGITRFIKRVSPYKWILIESFLINIVLGILSLSSPFLIQILTDDVLIRGDSNLLRGIAITIIIITIFSSLLNIVQANLITQFAQRLQLGLVMDFGRKILGLPLSYYETRRGGEVTSRLQDIQQINHLISSVVITLPSQFFIALISLGLMVVYSGKLVLIVVLITMLSTITSIIFLPELQQRVRSAMVLDAQNQGLLVETFKGALTLKTAVVHHQFREELQGQFSRLARLVYGTAQIGIINSVSSDLVLSIGSISLLWFGSNLVIGGELSIGQLLAFNTMSSKFLGFINTLIRFVDEYTHANTATQRLSEVIDTQPENDNTQIKAVVEIPVAADIQLLDLTFFHPGRENLIEHLSLTIPSTKTTVIIGQSGCGKSSLVKLMIGLYPYQSGNIRIGNFNLEDLELDCLRQQVVLVPQEPHFWTRSILENFQLISPTVTFEKIVSACQITGADEFISKLPGKYQTVLSEFGVNLSTGQRQRLAVARAIVTDPPILILDESTANLDPVTEAQMLNQLLSSRQGKTTLMISHRPKVIERADWIIYLEQGAVRLYGTPAELKKIKGDHLIFFDQ